MPYTVLDPALAAAAPTSTAGTPLTSQGETLATMRTELLLQLASRGDVDAPRLDKHINWAYRNVAGMLTLKELFAGVSISVVANQPFYALPICVSWMKRLGVSDTTNYGQWQGRELNLIDDAKYRTLPVLTDEPSSYFRWNRMVVLWPTPITARTLALDFRVRPEDLTADNHSPMLPQEFHEPILLSARHRAFRSLLMYKDAQLAYNDFLVCIRPLINSDAEELDASNAVFTPARSYSDLFQRVR